MALSPGDRFGRYEIVQVLGKGGMGEVYRAQDTVLHRRVALKILLGSEDAAEGNVSDGRSRILREARSAAGIEHPSAIAIYDVGEVDTVPFLAMEYVSGKPLRAYVGDASVHLSRRIRWLVDIARALGAAHELGVVHRDIKPENVMVRDDGVVKVLDFGIARRVRKIDPNAPTGPLETMTGAGIVMGTPLYMAPEQMRGESVDGRADQFAWGTVAYELLTGSVPWDRDGDSLKVVAQILTREVDAPRTRNPEIPAAVDAVIRIALSKMPAHRFASMGEIADELEPHAAAVGVVTGRGDGGRLAPPSGDPASFAPTQAVEVAPTAQGTPASPDGPQSGGRWAWRLGAGAAAMGALFFLKLGLAPHGSPNAVDAGTTPVNIESKMSHDPQATAAYLAGVRALKDACQDSAASELRRAIALDPGFAAAHLRRAFIPEYITTEMRQDLLDARNGRESLSEHDRILLDATEPWTRVPPDLRESQRRLEAAAKKYPASADFTYELGWTLDNLNDSRPAAAAFQETIARDPTFAMAWLMVGRERIYLGDVPGALEAYDRCLKVSPEGTTCLGDLADLQGNEGRCKELELTSRHLIAIAPRRWESHAELAEALFALGEPMEAVRGALAPEWERLKQQSPKWQEPHDEASLAILTGRFDDAQTWFHQLELSFDSSPDDVKHLRLAYDRALVALETGPDADALQIARDYLRRRSAWQSNDLAEDPSILLYSVELAAGGLSKPAFVELRDAWVKRSKDRDLFSGHSWAEAYALPAATREDASEALIARPDLHPLVDALTAKPYTDEPIGRTYLLAGHLDDSIERLTRASATCSVLEWATPIFSTWASFDLGQALEVRSDVKGACAAYATVLKRWGHARPRSRTAAKARSRVLALGCPSSQ